MEPGLDSMTLLDVGVALHKRSVVAVVERDVWQTKHGPSAAACSEMGQSGVATDPDVDAAGLLGGAE